MIVKTYRKKSISPSANEKLCINLDSTSNNKYYLDKEWIQWLVGFTDSEGNFNISLDRSVVINLKVSF